MGARTSPVAVIERGNPGYPETLDRFLLSSTPERLMTLGNPTLLDLPLLGLFGSVRTPPGIVLRALDLARLLRERRIPVAGGFQTPLEREMLRMFARGSQPIVIGAGRRIDGMRIPKHWQPAFGRAQILVIASGTHRWRRATVRSATFRNRMVAALANRILIVHARGGSRTFRIAAEAIEWGKPVYCVDHPANRDLQLLGAEPVGDWAALIDRWRAEGGGAAA